MLSQGKILYQVKLILDCLPKEEYKLIPEETIEYIEKKFEYDENFSIDPNIPLENQKIDDRTYELLDKIIKFAEKRKKVQEKAKIDEYVKNVRESNEKYDAKIENIRLKNLVEILKKENSKIPMAKGLVQEYKDALNEKDKQIQKLKRINECLIDIFNKIPKFIRELFIGENEIKLLNNVK